MRPCLVVTWSTRTLVAATLPASETKTSIPGSAALAASTERAGAGNDDQRAFGLKEFGGLRTDTAGASADESYLAVELGHRSFLTKWIAAHEMGSPLARTMAPASDFCRAEAVGLYGGNAIWKDVFNAAAAASLMPIVVSKLLAIVRNARRPESGLRPSAISAFGAILLQKSSWGEEQKFLGPLMHFLRVDVRDHIVSSKIDHGPS